MRIAIGIYGFLLGFWGFGTLRKCVVVGILVVLMWCGAVRLQLDHDGVVEKFLQRIRFHLLLHSRQMIVQDLEVGIR